MLIRDFLHHRTQKAVVVAVAIQKYNFAKAFLYQGIKNTINIINEGPVIDIGAAGLLAYRAHEKAVINGTHNKNRYTRVLTGLAQPVAQIPGDDGVSLNR